jgi:hypothetical protein
MGLSIVVRITANGFERLVGLVTPETDAESPKKTYAYDPHLTESMVALA